MKEIFKGKNCPVARSSALVGDMWTMLIIRDLLAGRRRFIELQSTLISSTNRKINSRTLCSRLRMLEMRKVLIRKEFLHELPPHVEYSLTPKGKALSAVIDKIRQYGEKYP